MIDILGKLSYAAIDTKWKGKKRSTQESRRTDMESIFHGDEIGGRKNSCRQFDRFFLILSREHVRQLSPYQT